MNELLDRIQEAAEENDPVSLEAILDLVGRRSFGPLLLLSGLLAVAPVIGDVPGVPTGTGIVVFLLAIQLLIGRARFWIPAWLLNRTVARAKLCKALGWMRPPARFLDRLLRPRLEMLTGAAATRLIAAVCVLIAVAMPAMEVVPFAANFAGAAITVFGLSLIGRDGVMALVALGCTTATAALLAYNLV